MKRVIIIVLLILAILFGYQIVVNGIENGEGEILVSSYKQVEEASADLVSDVASYNNLNDLQYNEMLTNLSTTREEYEEIKVEYEDLIEEIGDILGDSQSVIYAPLSIYEIDFLWTIIGNYARTEGIILTMDVSKSTVSTSDTSGYSYYNLNFSVSGEYIDIANFLYDIEDDDRLSFEIRDFSMTSAAAAFTVYGVPIDNETMILSNTDNTLTTETTTEDDTDITNSVGNETIESNSENNTLNEENSTNTDNTSNVTNTTNTVNNTTN